MPDFFVVGKNISHTMSPEIHKEFGFDYGVADLNESSFADFFHSKNFYGVNVTIPYKQEVFKYLDYIDELAEAVGAVNTVANDGKLYGYNTDVCGMEFALAQAGINIIGKNLLILGSGGTCKAAKIVAKRQGAKSVSVVSRTGSLNYENCYALAPETEIIINATPVGMYPNANKIPIDLNRFCRIEGVFDAIYNPLKTKLVQDAEALGLKCANGFYMLVEQARLAHNIFVRHCGYGEMIDVNKSAEVAEKLLKSKRNIVLIGMSGSGKTTIGKFIADALDREFIDTDSEIEKLTGKTVSQIFDENGEVGFRQLENEIVKKTMLKTGAVISLGGGAVLDSENRFYLKCNSVAVLVERDINKIELADRPLTKNREKAKSLYEKRKPLYQSLADVTICNDGYISFAVAELLDKL